MAASPRSLPPSVTCSAESSARIRSPSIRTSGSTSPPIAAACSTGIPRARASFGHEAEYTRVIAHEAEESYAFWDYGPELSRRFRALKVWMMLAHAGTRVLGEAVERNCRCARRLSALVEASEDLEMLAPVELSIFCFRYVPEGLKAARAATAERPDGEDEDKRIDRALDELNERILVSVQREGNSYVSNARVGGRFALRGWLLNFRTTERDMEILLQDVRQAGERLR